MYTGLSRLECLQLGFENAIRGRSLGVRTWTKDAQGDFRVRETVDRTVRQQGQAGRVEQSPGGGDAPQTGYIETAPWTFSARLPCPWWRPQWPPSPILSCRGGFSFARELSSALRAVVGNMFMRVVGFAGSKDMLTTRDTMWLELHNMFAVR